MQQLFSKNCKMHLTSERNRTTIIDGRTNVLCEVMCLVLGDWQQLKRQNGQALSPDLPVIFHTSLTEGLAWDTYCEGVSVQVDRYWDGRKGWQPCIRVELGAPL